MSRLKARSHLAHGDAIYPPAHPEDVGASGLVQVRVQYDVYSSFPLIEHILRSTFDVAEPDEHLQRLYNLGFAVVGPFESGDAVSRVQRARAVAAAEDAPLRLSIEPPVADGAIVPGAPEW